MATGEKRKDLEDSPVSTNDPKRLNLSSSPLDLPKKVDKIEAVIQQKSEEMIEKLNKSTLDSETKNSLTTVLTLLTPLIVGMSKAITESIETKIDNLKIEELTVKVKEIENNVENHDTVIKENRKVI